MADLQNAEDLFGVGEVDLDDPASPAGGGRAVMPKMAREGPTLDQLDPDTEEDFDLYLSELERKLDFGSVRHASMHMQLHLPANPRCSERAHCLLRKELVRK